MIVTLDANFSLDFQGHDLTKVVKSQLHEFAKKKKRKENRPCRDTYFYVLKVISTPSLMFCPFPPVNKNPANLLPLLQTTLISLFSLKIQYMYFIASLQFRKCHNPCKCWTTSHSPGLSVYLVNKRWHIKAFIKQMTLIATNRALWRGAFWKRFQ